MTFAPVRPPLRFAAPAGWPEPSPAWVARNQGWQPPVGWLPPVVAGWPAIAPAPQGWQFWAPEPGAWQAFSEPYRRSAKRQILIGALMFGIGSIVTILGYLGDLGQTFLILWGAIIFGFIRLVSGLANLRKADRDANRALSARSLQVRRDQDAAAYPRYLAETAAERAATGRPAMSLEEFSSALDAEPWGAATATPPAFGDAGALAPYGSPAGGVPPYSAPSTGAPAYGAPGVGPSAYGAPGAGAPAYAMSSAWAPPLVGRARLVRRRFWIPIAIIVALLLAFAVPGIIQNASHDAASTTGSAPVGGSNVNAGSPDSPNTNTGSNTDAGNYAFADKDWTLVQSGACTAADGCWQLELTAPSTCPAATFTWGFSDSKTGDDKATRTTTVALTAGQKSHVTIPIDDQLNSLDYIFLDSVNCG
ncbi:hypothetical protein AX769_00525 [Frondihabitans sp. PAMC 28766]|uniref:hypothetical protein n=1 Tax=Frondihabitans sp. PAMC 28766 TaxID=1795630 RepID=UPI00078D28EB|nr:hypothetical protein [Frondihabitans sp. PAMC 28766]AMM18898.1 hypothetical protein AX769_00525 [Frondihabitans sp. PAMC 28766]